MGRQVYVYQGQEYSLPDTLSPEEALGKIKGHIGIVEQQPKPQSLGDEFIEGAKGTAAAIGDIAGGMLKVPASALLAAGGKIADPSLPLQSHWEAAQQAVEDTFPSIGSQLGVQDNLGYTAPLKPFELYGQGANYIAKQASFGNKDVEGALNIGANFLPIPFVGKAGKLARTAIENIDPGLRNIKAKKPSSERISNLDNIDAEGSFDTSTGVKAGEMPGEVNPEYMAARRAQEFNPVIPPEEIARRQTDSQNQAFLDEQAKARMEREQATQGPEIPIEEVNRRAVAEHNKAYLDEMRPRLDELGERQRLADEALRSEEAQRQAQETINRRQAELEREVRDAKTREEVESIVSRQEAERAQLQEVQNKLNELSASQKGTDLGYNTPGNGVGPRRQMVGGSRLMGEPIPEPRGPVGLSTGEGLSATGNPRNRPTVSSGLMGLRGKVDTSLDLGRNTIGTGVGISRKPVTDSGLMGGPIPEKVPPVGLSTGEGLTATGNKPGKPVTGSGLMGTPKPEVSDPFKALTQPSVVKKTTEPSRTPVQPSTPKGDQRSTNPFGSISGIPRGQRGGINFGEISKALGSVKSAISNVFSRLPGTSEIGKMLEQVYPDIDKLRQQIIDAKVNSKQYLNKLQSGSSLSYIQTKDPLIRAVSTIMQTAAKRVDNAIQQHVKPIEHALDNLRKTDPQAFNDLGEVFKREMLGRKTYTPEQLAKAGFSEEQVGIYTQMRELYDKSYKVQNAVLEQQGRPTLTKQEYYMASRWEGDWGTNVYGKDGKLLWVVRGGSKAEVEAGLKHLKESGIEFDSEKSKPTYTRKDPGKWVDYPAAYSSMLQHLTETNPMSKAAREAYETMSADEVFKTLGQNKHFLEKANIRGFAGDRPWKDRLTDTTDMFYNQMQYNKNAFEWAEMQNAGKMATELLGDETIRKQSPDSVEYAQNVVDRYTGKGDHQMFTKLENSIAKGIGRSTQDLRNITAGAKSLWIIQKLATNLGNTFIQNPLQFVNSFSWHTDLTSSGYKHNALKTFANSFSDTMAGLSQHYGDYLGLKGFGSASKFGQAAINYARSNGLLEMNVFDEHTDMRTPEVIKKYQSTLGRLQIESDKLSRFAAFMGFAHHLEQSGKFTDKMELFREAEHYTRGSMVDQSFKERPFIVQDTGIAGTLGSALQGYSLNYLNQLGGFARKASKGNVLPLATFLATSAALSGVGGVAAFNWMGDMYDKLRDNSPNMYTSLPDYRQTMIDLEGDGSFYRTAMVRGLPAAITGLDIGKKFESSLPSTPIVGMAKDIGQQALDVGGALSDGNLTKAAYAVAPAGLGKGMLEVHSDLFKSPYSDKYSDSKGNFGRGIFRDDKDKLFKSLGLPTIAEARQKEAIFASEKDRQNNSQATKYFANRIINAWGKGTNPEGDIAKLAKINPEALNQLQANQEQYIKQATMPYKALQADKAKSSASAKRLIDYGTQ